MFACHPARIALCLASMLLAADVSAAGRAIRVDNDLNWTISNIGTAACAGTAVGSILIARFGHGFSGRGNTATENYNTSDYCETALPGTLNQIDYSHSDEPGLRAVFGGGIGITAIRYDFLDDVLSGSPDGFQWGFYTFPSGATLVGLYGLNGVNGIFPDATSYIKNGPTYVWHGSNGYNGEYYCFQNNAYVGSWDGNASATNNACLQAVGVVFINGFEGN